MDMLQFLNAAITRFGSRLTVLGISSNVVEIKIAYYSTFSWHNGTVRERLDTGWAVTQRSTWLANTLNPALTRDDEGNFVQRATA